MAAVVAAVPWKEILRTLPVILDGANRLWKYWSAKKGQALDPKADFKTQLLELGERLSALESAEAEQAKLVAEVAEQLQAVARRASMTYWLALGALVVSCATLLIAALR